MLRTAVLFSLLFLALVPGPANAGFADDVPRVQQLKAVPHKPGSGAQLLRLSSIFVEASNDLIGERRTGLFCSKDADFYFRDAWGKDVLGDNLVHLRKELLAHGYPAPVASVFKDAARDAEVEYELGLTLVDFRIKFCLNSDKVKGGVWVKLRAELFSPRERRVMFTGLVEGSAHYEESTKGDADDLIRGATLGALRNLLANPQFVAQATQPARVAAKPQEAELLVLRRSAGKDDVQRQMPLLQSAVATVYSGSVSGSAFFVSSEGHLLTNKHVVGDAKFVKIRLASGRELLGEVLRSNGRRDVALVKTEPVALTPFEVTDSEPQSGAEVYALGSPLGEQLASTVTRGVVSSLREVDQQRWLQSDVKILPGSSGGPLVDRNGAVVGLASNGLGQGNMGVNFFVPIREAMSVLQLGFK